MGFNICGIYEKRPAMCRHYPQPLGGGQTSYTPPGCTYWFDGEGKRHGECDPFCRAACCLVERAGGEPEGEQLDGAAGGLPCKHLVWSDTHPCLRVDTSSGGDREEAGEGVGAFQQILSQISGGKTSSDETKELGVEARKTKGG
ncbi:hypothetical protein UFOVP276_158 [uncultured Caudovirales phage]|uniref:Zinc- or iron-chelating domain containing protein n=1 Tax=uncultured Caudovirales phage TaxID=2100421 RepID=A0A6J5LNH8_9CAUD|nr:hypothetical protein UFOVP127_52 [uncultured Caudovirales phage]CAB4135202.1 hypothetical protein UFOVP276_158 [uncultured Caudovirales phage]